MSGEQHSAWHARNQEDLAERIRRMRVLLESRLAGEAGEDEALSSVAPPGLPPETVGALTDKPPSIDLLARAFGLSRFEQHVLVLCAAAELDGAVGGLCARLNGDAQVRVPTFGLALGVLPDAHWSALSPDAPLRRFLLIDVLQGATLTGSPLRIEERVLHFLTGVDATEARFAGLIESIDSDSEIASTHAAIAREVMDAWCSEEGALAVQLCGRAAEDKRGIFVHACRTLGLRAMRLTTEALPSDAASIEFLGRLWTREAALGGCALFFDWADGFPESARAVAQLAEQVKSPLVLSARERRYGIRRAIVTLEVEKPPAREQAAAWRRSLALANGSDDRAIDTLVAQFSFSSATIDSIARRALAQRADSAAPGDTLWRLCRVEARPRMEEQAQRIATRTTWDQLILAPFETQILHDIARHVRARARVHDAWGIADRSARGMAITALFSGASGTGKTMAAEVIANDLDLDLYRIDLSQIVSKYIGETEKNLRRVFDAAEEGGAILLFDEADALFGKRSEVKDSHDRYANIEVSYLLQRMEAYRGLAILTTNLKDSLDAAFLRRIRFWVDFPFPTVEQRSEIWRTVFPSGMPRGELSYERLARLNIAGGNIRNIAVYAAFLAAETDGPVTMKHLYRAAQVEFAKLQRPWPDADTRGWS